ncbi:MAG: ABC transporter substrate-binding protein [Verrucomicrobia bacterium]|nr:ABC transporter substrate-binding protein [Verrucomicrobiota bacterium]
MIFRSLVFAGTTAVLALLAGCSKSPTQTQLIRVSLQTDWYPQAEHGGFYNALVKGYYKEAGLDVTILPGGPNSSPTKLLMTGGADFGMDSSDHVLVADAEGLDIVAVGATMQQDPQAVMLHAEDPASRFEDLEGRTVAAVPGAIWFQYLIHKFGFKNTKEIPATFTVANFLHDPQYAQQIFVTSEPFYVQKEGQKTKVLLIKDTGYAPYRVFCCTRAYLNKNRDVVQRFVAASVRGWRDYIQDPAAANAEIAKCNPEMNKDQMEFSWKALKDGGFVYGADASGAATGKFEAQRWTDLYQILRDLNVITKDIDPRQAYTLDFTKNL